MRSHSASPSVSSELAGLGDGEEDRVVDRHVPRLDPLHEVDVSKETPQVESRGRRCGDEVEDRDLVRVPLTDGVARVAVDVADRRRERRGMAHRVRAATARGSRRPRRSRTRVSAKNPGRVGRTASNTFGKASRASPRSRCEPGQLNEWGRRNALRWRSTRGSPSARQGRTRSAGRCCPRTGPQDRQRLAASVDVVELQPHHLAQDPPAPMRRVHADGRHAGGRQHATRHRQLDS